MTSLLEMCKSTLDSSRGEVSDGEEGKKKNVDLRKGEGEHEFKMRRE